MGWGRPSGWGGRFAPLRAVLDLDSTLQRPVPFEFCVWFAWIVAVSEASSRPSTLHCVLPGGGQPSAHTAFLREDPSLSPAMLGISGLAVHTHARLPGRSTWPDCWHSAWAAAKWPSSRGTTRRHGASLLWRLRQCHLPLNRSPKSSRAFFKIARHSCVPCRQPRPQHYLVRCSCVPYSPVVIGPREGR